MTRSEQHQLIQRLRDFSSLMKGKDLYDYEMFLKRDRDDEDLDALSVRRLEELHERYVPKKTKKDLDALLKKYASEQNKSHEGQ